MDDHLKKIMYGYKNFKNKFDVSYQQLLEKLSIEQKPKTMVVSCCDSRVDPGLMLQCDPGDLFVVRNVANIVPPYEIDELHHGTSAALEFGIRGLEIQDLIILGHSNCGGINAALNMPEKPMDDFVTNWVSIVNTKKFEKDQVDACAKDSLLESYKNCRSFPWIEGRIITGKLKIHLWFFDIKEGEIMAYDFDKERFDYLDIVMAK